MALRYGIPVVPSAFLEGDVLVAQTFCSGSFVVSVGSLVTRLSKRQLSSNKYTTASYRVLLEHNQ